VGKRKNDGGKIGEIWRKQRKMGKQVKGKKFG
jgi:hypothetical protein